MIIREWDKIWTQRDNSEKEREHNKNVCANLSHLALPDSAIVNLVVSQIYCFCPWKHFHPYNVKTNLTYFCRETVLHVHLHTIKHMLCKFSFFCGFWFFSAMCVMNAGRADWHWGLNCIESPRARGRCMNMTHGALSSLIYVLSYFYILMLNSYIPMTFISPTLDDSVRTDKV